MKIIIILMSFILLLISSNLKAEEYPTKASETEFVTVDLENFWVAYDRYQRGEDLRTVLEEDYFGKASNGLIEYRKMGLNSTDALVDSIESHPIYYSQLRASVSNLPAAIEKVRSALEKLEKDYDQAVFPPVYFLVGAFQSGGIAIEAGLMIGTEMYGLGPKADPKEFRETFWPILRPVSSINRIVTHELIHYQQSAIKDESDGADTLLLQSVREGVADFVAELMSGGHINDVAHAYANPREEELWKEFQSIMLGKERNGWLYGSSGVANRPSDLGYWMGYKITAAYYERADNKRKALAHILNPGNVEVFLKESHYGDQFK